MKIFFKVVIPLVAVFFVLFFAWDIFYAGNNSNSNSSVIGNSSTCNIKYMPNIKQYNGYPNMCINENTDYYGQIQTSLGNIDIKLLTPIAPKTVNSFIFLSKSGFYSNLTFHRVIPGFVIQGGDPTGTGTGGPGYSFADEINPYILGLQDSVIQSNIQSGYIYSHSLQTIHLTQGVLAMANSGANTNGSQFFITLSDQSSSLDGKYTPFGIVTKGMNIAQSIANVQTDSNNKPLKNVVIYKILIGDKPFN